MGKPITKSAPHAAPSADVFGGSSIAAPHLASLQLRCITVACIFWTFTASTFLLSMLVFWILLIPTWLAAEVLFVGVYLHLYNKFNRQPLPHVPKDVDARAVFNRFVVDQAQMAKYLDIRHMLQRWYWGKPMAQLSRTHLADLLSYGFWYKSRGTLEAEGQGHLPEQLAQEVATAWGLELKDDPAATPLPFMAHLWQPIRCFYRPLIFYMIIELVILYKHVLMLSCGFKSYVSEGYRYYTYGNVAPPRSKAMPAGLSRLAPPPPAPLLFLHGVGLGLLPYLSFVMRLAASGQPIMAVEVRHLSMRVCREVPEEDVVVEVVMRVLDRHGLTSAHVVAHSYGTFLASRITQIHPTRVASLTLLDPVCFCMFTGKLIHNFVYHNPLRGARLLTWFIARDMAHAVSVSRKFYWTLLNLWPDQLPRHTLVVLSAKDELVPVQEVMGMLEGDGNAQLLYHPHHCHAGFIVDLPWQGIVAQRVLDLVAAAGVAAGLQAHGRSDSASSYEQLARAERMHAKHL